MPTNPTHEEVTAILEADLEYAERKHTAAIIDLWHVADEYNSPWPSRLTAFQQARIDAASAKVEETTKRRDEADQILEAHTNAAVGAFTQTVKCLYCDWQGAEDALELCEDMDGLFKGCPKCLSDNHLIDADGQ